MYVEGKTSTEAASWQYYVSINDLELELQEMHFEGSNYTNIFCKTEFKENVFIL